MSIHKALYGRKWRAARLIHLSREPLCRMCADDGQVTAAAVVDHITPHRGDARLFWDRANWQSLCAHHHNSVKQAAEVADMVAPVMCDADGYPTEGGW